MHTQSLRNQERFIWSWLVTCIAVSWTFSTQIRNDIKVSALSLWAISVMRQKNNWHFLKNYLHTTYVYTLQYQKPQKDYDRVIQRVIFLFYHLHYHLPKWWLFLPALLNWFWYARWETLLIKSSSFIHQGPLAKRLLSRNAPPVTQGLFYNSSLATCVLSALSVALVSLFWLSPPVQEHTRPGVLKFVQTSADFCVSSWQSKERGERNKNGKSNVIVFKWTGTGREYGMPPSIPRPWVDVRSLPPSSASSVSLFVGFRLYGGSACEVWSQHDTTECWVLFPSVRMSYLLSVSLVLQTWLHWVCD